MSKTFTIDRFATAANSLCDKFNSFYYEIRTHGIDAFSQDDYLLYYNFFNPPFSVLGRLVKFLILHYPNLCCAIIFPAW
jgi:hypothetical protein